MINQNHSHKECNKKKKKKMSNHLTPLMKLSLVLVNSSVLAHKKLESKDIFENLIFRLCQSTSTRRHFHIFFFKPEKQHSIQKPMDEYLLCLQSRLDCYESLLQLLQHYPNDSTKDERSHYNYELCCQDSAMSNTHTHTRLKYYLAEIHSIVSVRSISNAQVTSCSICSASSSCTSTGSIGSRR
jgi:hypothetical protein